MLAWRTVESRKIPIVGIASGSAGRRGGNETLARYNLYRILPTSKHRRIELIGRGLRDPDGPVIEVERQLLEPAPEGAAG